ncbi:MAG: D-aminoacyl-tRNA deacylase [Desulfobacterales bacterium]
MRVLIQRVQSSQVSVAGRVVGSIGPGLLVFLGVAAGDGEADVAYLAEKIVNLRIFEDDQGKMNRSLKATGGAMLVVSQFTLLGDCRKGRRPSFSGAASPGQARQLYEAFVREVGRLGITTATGEFQAHMQVALVNDGPVTLLLESPTRATAV